MELVHDQLAKILNVNKGKELKELIDSFNIIFKHTWQPF